MTGMVTPFSKEDTNSKEDTKNQSFKKEAKANMR
jgi:hypothetical protein